MATRLVCIKKCLWGRVYNEGDYITVINEADIPKSTRPYFKKQSEVEQVIEDQAAKNLAAHEIKELRRELDLMGIAYDRNASKSTLQSILATAKRDSIIGDEPIMPELNKKTEPVGITEIVDTEEANAESAPEPESEAHTFPSQMNKTQLRKFATELGISFTEDHIKKELRSLIGDKQKESTVTEV